MSVKDRLITTLRQAGFSFVTACELATEKLREARALPPGGAVTFACGDRVFTLRKD